MAVINCKGDLLKALEDGKIAYAIHQVNCQGRMGSGIAKSIRAKYPIVYDNYMAKVQPAKDEGLHMELLGDIQVCAVYEDFYKIADEFKIDNPGVSIRSLQEAKLNNKTIELKRKVLLNLIGFPVSVIPFTVTVLFFFAVITSS